MVETRLGTGFVMMHTFNARHVENVSGNVSVLDNHCSGVHGPRFLRQHHGLSVAPQVRRPAHQPGRGLQPHVRSLHRHRLRPLHLLRPAHEPRPDVRRPLGHRPARQHHLHERAGVGQLLRQVVLPDHHTRGKGAAGVRQDR